MKIRAIVAALLLAVLLTGCSMVGLDAATLMHPPKPTGDRQNIHSLIEKKAAGYFSLKYPRDGDYRSAIIMHNITGDKQEEAIAFYQSGKENSGISVIFMKNIDGEWKEIGTFNNPATQVDKVCFGDINGDGEDEAVIGWGNAINSMNDLSFYYFKSNKVSEVPLKQAYSEMTVMDFDGDGREEIFTASVTTQEQLAAARLIRIKKDNTNETISSAHLDAEVTKYCSLKAGRINESQFGVVLDGAKSSNTFVTEILYWDKESKSMKAPFYDVSTKTADYTLRNTSVVSKDINKDKIIEIPIVNLMPGYVAPVANEACYFTNWHRYDPKNDNLIKVMSMAINSVDGYWLLIPDMWRGKVTAKTDMQTHSMTFYEWTTTAKKKDGAVGTALLKLQVFTKEQWNSLQKSNSYYQLMVQNGMIYAANIPKPNHALSLNIADVKKSFKLIVQE